MLLDNSVDEVERSAMAVMKHLDFMDVAWVSKQNEK